MVHDPLTQIHARICANTHDRPKHFTHEPTTPHPHSHPPTSHQTNPIQTTRTSTNIYIPQQVQTPQQRRANEAFAKSEAAKRGKPQTEVERLAEKKKAAKLQAQKSPVSKVWLCKFPNPVSLLELSLAERQAEG
jgi:hypothetical protein